METIRFIVPIKTISRANSSEHWRSRDARVRRERTTTVLAWRAVGSPPIPTPSTVTLTRVAPRAMDDDNLRMSMKAIRDQIAELAGVDDRHSKIIRYEYDQRKPSKPKTYEVEVLIEERAA